MAHNNLATPDPELAPLLAQLPPAPGELCHAGLEAARDAFNSVILDVVQVAQRKILPPDSAYTTKDHKVPVEGGEITVRSYTPNSSDENKRHPLLFWTHGGGWVLGTLDVDDLYLRILSVALQIVVVQADYRLAPEYPFPIGHNDSYAALKWTAKNADSLGADLSKGFCVGGGSAGGNLAAALTHRAKADPAFAQHPLTGQLLLYPATVHPDAVPPEYKDRYTAYEQMTKVDMLPSRYMYEFYKLLQAEPTNPDISPLLQPSFTGIPPATILVCGMDPLRDDGILYAEKLQAAGVPTRLYIYPGATHGFHASFAHTKIAQKFEAEVKDGLRWMLAGAPTTD